MGGSLDDGEDEARVELMEAGMLVIDEEGCAE